MNAKLTVPDPHLRALAASILAEFGIEREKTRSRKLWQGDK